MAKTSVGAECKAVLQQKLGPELDDETIAKSVDRLVAKRNEILRADKTIAKEDAHIQAAQVMGDDDMLKVVAERRSRAINVLRKKERMAFYASYGEGREYEAVLARTVGIQSGDAGAGLSINAQAIGIAGDLIGHAEADLKRAGLFKVFMNADRAFDLEISREIARITNPNEVPTGNKQAEKIASVLHEYQEMSRAMKNRQGAWVRSTPGYIVRQTHDQFLMVRAGFQKWKDFILPRLDPDRTFSDMDPDQIDSFLKNAYDGLVSGMHLKAEGGKDWLLSGMGGPGNLAKKVSQDRSLHFKDATSWHEYNVQFGTGSLRESWVKGIQHDARNIALMRWGGTNPEAALTRDIEQLAIRARERGDFDTVKKLQSDRLMKRYLPTIMGTGNIPDPSGQWLANLSTEVRALETMSKLGGTVLSSVGDPVNIAMTMKRNGVGIVRGLGQFTSNLFESLGEIAAKSPSEARLISDATGVGIDDMLGSAGQQLVAADSERGVLSKHLQTYFRWNLLEQWTNSAKRGVGAGLQREMFLRRDTAFDQLPEYLQNTYRRYGIQQGEWDLIRTAEPVVDQKGRERIVTDSVRGLSDERIREYLGNPDASDRQVQGARDDLAMKTQAYFIDQAGEALVEPTDRERALTRFGRKGTMIGTLGELAMQFKMYGVTMFMRQVAPMFSRMEHVDKVSLIQFAVMTTVAGYISTSLRDFVMRGKTPKIPDDADSAVEILVASMKQGGGAGILGDFIFSEYNRMGNSLAETLAGPAISTAFQIGRTANSTIRALGHPTDGDKWSKAGMDAVNLLKSNTPGLNLFYIQQAVNFLFLHSLQEAIRPGYLARMERRAEKENQSYLYPPSTYHVPIFD